MSTFWTWLQAVTGYTPPEIVGIVCSIAIPYTIHACHLSKEHQKTFLQAAFFGFTWIGGVLKSVKGVFNPQIQSRIQALEDADAAALAKIAALQAQLAASRDPSNKFRVTP